MSRCLLLSLFCFIPTILLAQGPPGLGGAALMSTSGNITENRLVQGIMGTHVQKLLGAIVYSPEGKPLSGARIMVTNNASMPLQSFYTDHAGGFQADYDIMDSESGREFVATIAVNKKGYQVLHRVVVMPKGIDQLGIAITLTPTEERPNPLRLSEQELIDAVAPRFRNLGPADGLTKKGQKEYARGVEDFLDHHHLDQAVPHLLKVTEVDPTCVKCSTMLSLAELAWGDWDDPKRDLDKSIAVTEKDSKLAFAELYLIYGVLWEWRDTPRNAVGYLQKAAEIAPQDATVQQELGRALCLNLDFWDADASLRKAIAGGAGPDAHLLHAEALEWIGNPTEAMAEMNRYLAGRSPRSLPPSVRDLYEQIRAGKKDQAIVATLKAKAKARGVVPLDYLHYPTAKLPGLVPASDQKPLEAILAAAGKNVEEFFATLPDICSVEKVNQERLTGEGKDALSQQRKYTYLMVVPDKRWGPGIEEYRADPKGKLTAQPPLDDTYMLTEGFVSAPLVFYPVYQQGSSYRLLGTQEVEGRKDYVVVYAQRPGRTPLSGTFMYGATVQRFFTQGIAWIDSENFEIVRMITDLLDPLPELRLDKETTDITFEKVNFKMAAHGFWLPKEVTVNLAWNGRLLRNEHSYSDFLLSNVKSEQKIGKPKGAEGNIEDASAPAAVANTREKKAPQTATQ